MLFNSFGYLLFLSVILVLYWILRGRWRLWLLLAGGCYFYGSWDWRFLILLFFTSGVDFLAAGKISNAESAYHKRFWLFASVSCNLLVLGFFKYYNFFSGSFADLLVHFGLKANFTTLNVILPLGISFYTFQAIAYVIDVYRGRVNVERDPLVYFTFICFFPQMVAGPIERAKRMLPQFHAAKRFRFSLVQTGIALMLYGYLKKVVIADNLAVLVDALHSDPAAFSSFQLLLGVFAFALQIYADFSGYTDIARGSALMLGFRLSRNFALPYFSASFSEFWSRWHISLSTWFRDYVYIPLGGNRSGRVRRNLNLLFTFIVSGLWHGANFTFIAWGFFHGLFLVIEKTFKTIRLPKIVGRTIVFFCVSFLFTLFRSPSWSHFVLYSRCLLGNLGGARLSVLPESGSWFLVPLAIFVLFEWLLKSTKPIPGPLTKLAPAFIFLIILLYGVFENAPSFIYFQF